MQEVAFALSLARLKAGNNSPAKMAIMAMTTSSSIRVNARYRSAYRWGGNDGRCKFIGIIQHFNFPTASTGRQSLKTMMTAGHKRPAFLNAAQFSQACYAGGGGYAGVSARELNLGRFHPL
jgi:hypothetical protein